MLEFSTAWVLAVTLLLVRWSALLAFVPIPGLRQYPVPVKAFLALTLTLLFAPLAAISGDVSWLGSPEALWTMAGMVLSEAAFGLALGAALALLLDAFGLAAQILGFQAGYSYINMVDPTTQVDASILNVILALLSSLLFFVFDLHLYLVRALLVSLEEWPLGSFMTKPADAWMIIELGGAVIDTALRLAFPVVAVLLLIDLTLGLLNQVNSRLQLLTLAFPAKIVAALALLIPVVALGPRLFYQLAERTREVIEALVRQ